MSPTTTTIHSPSYQTASPALSARTSRIKGIRDRLVQLQQEYHDGVLGGEDSSDGMNDTSLNASDVSIRRGGRGTKPLNPARCRVCVCGPSISSILSREKVALVRKDRERVDGTVARQLAELEARAVDGEGRYEAALADLTRRIQEAEAEGEGIRDPSSLMKICSFDIGQQLHPSVWVSNLVFLLLGGGSSATRAEDIRERLDRLVSANATLRADLQEREARLEKEEGDIQREMEQVGNYYCSRDSAELCYGLVLP
ncbi:hypothetical protein FOL47_009209 [Perkinsus chesapeaki]|uniref:Uncharacterized protein n=1 Tax=Perkinsus chesapeaki TaxID=330153 RepID=A0A7J6L9Z4_PERCH|nr:hypothetical protein FOL47_009209 [Perkinsus chesapeaki]